MKFYEVYDRQNLEYDSYVYPKYIQVCYYEYVRMFLTFMQA